MKVTKWIDWKEKPIHKGWYQVFGYFYETHPRKGIVFRYFSGSNWKWKDTRDGKMKLAEFGGCESQDKWRGLTLPFSLGMRSEPTRRMREDYKYVYVVTVVLQQDMEHEWEFNSLEEARNSINIISDIRCQ